MGYGLEDLVNVGEGDVGLEERKGKGVGYCPSPMVSRVDAGYQPQREQCHVT